MPKEGRSLKNLLLRKNRHLKSPSQSQPATDPDAQSHTTTSARTSQEDFAECKPEKNVALQDAIRKYCQDLSESDRKAFEDALLHTKENTLLDQIQIYDASHRNSSRFRPRTKTITKFLNLIQTFVAGISTAIQANPNPAAIVVGAVQIVLSTALKFVTFFDQLTDMIGRLNEYLGPINEFAKGAKDSEILRRTLADVYGDLLGFWTAAHHIFVDERGNSRQFVTLLAFVRVQWDPFESKFGNIDQRFKHHLDVLNQVAQALQLNTTIQLEHERKGMHQ